MMTTPGKRLMVTAMILCALLNLFFWNQPVTPWIAHGTIVALSLALAVMYAKE